MTDQTQQQSESAKKSTRQSDVLEFLDSLDEYAASPSGKGVPQGAGATPATTAAAAGAPGGTPTGTSSQQRAKPDSRPGSAQRGAAAPPNAQEAQSVLDFLDEITQRSATPTQRPQAHDGASPARRVAPLSAAGTSGGGAAPGGSLSRSGSRQSMLTGSAAGGAHASSPAPPRRSGESVRSRNSMTGASTPAQAQAAAAPSPARSTAAPAPPQPAAAQQQQPQQEGGWGWSSFFSTATSAVQQARNMAEEQVRTASSNTGGLGAGLSGLSEGLMKALGEGNTEQAKKWGEGVMQYAREAHLDQLGRELKSSTLKSLTDLVHAVAPPIAEHEVIEVNLTHDMVGYDGVEALVYRSLAKVMESVEGGSLVVNRGADERPREEDEDVRELNALEGLAEAWKLAQANLDELVKKTYNPEHAATKEQTHNDVTVPVTHCPVYLRIQPCLAPLPALESLIGGANSSEETAPTSQRALYFLLLLRDPGHRLVHATTSQAMPASWLDIPYEENEWVEDCMVDIIRRSIEVVGLEYVTHRMRARTDALSKARQEAQAALAAAQSSQSATIASDAHAADGDDKNTTEALANSAAGVTGV